MGFVPEQIVKNGLPTLMDNIIEAGINDPQVLFCGIGDFVYDAAPLQVGQFESSADLLDRWLTRVYLEGGGGGNRNESYNLAYLLAARHTSTDAWEKRGEKGFLFTVGDEPCASAIPREIIERLTTGSDRRTVSTGDILAEARERYNVYHIHVVHDAASKFEDRKQGWEELLGSNFVVLQDVEDLSRTVASIVIDHTSSPLGDTAPPAGAIAAGTAVDSEWML